MSGKKEKPAHNIMKTMKALVKAKPEKGLWMEQKPIPEPGLNDVIIRVKKSAICGTDLHIYEWDAWSQRTIKTPMTIGHEYMGYIEKMGAGVSNLKIGETWSPDDNSLLGRLVKICDNLHSIGDRKDVSQTDILKEIEELIKELKQ